MSLRGLLIVVAGTALFLALTASAALIQITSWMGENTQQVLQSAESMRVAQEIEVALLDHTRDRRLAALTGEENALKSMQQARDRLLDRLSKAGSHVTSLAEGSILQELKQTSTKYLERVEQLKAQGHEYLAEEPHLVDPALGNARSLVEINFEDAKRVAKEAQQWDRLANRLGILVSTALCLGIGLALWCIRRAVYQPLLAIRNALLRFRLGAPGMRIAETGPLELREISLEFNEMATRLERQREVQLRFVAGVAHDLRNPLSALKLSAEAVRPDRPLPPEEKVRERFALVARQVERLARMVEDLLDTARIEAGKLELRLEEQDLRGLLRDAVALHQELSPAHVLALHMPEAPVPVRCDATRISQVLNNLLSNAIKYSPQGGQVRIELTTAPEAAWVAVKDSGVGVPASERESIFEPFRRSAATRDSIPGVGLGLAVGRRIIEAHGGHIEVESEEGVGSTFRFHLPRVPHPNA